jgi:hypothetical protein
MKNALILILNFSFLFARTNVSPFLSDETVTFFKYFESESNIILKKNTKNALSSFSISIDQKNLASFDQPYYTNQNKNLLIIPNLIMNEDEIHHEKKDSDDHKLIYRAPSRILRNYFNQSPYFLNKLYVETNDFGKQYIQNTFSEMFHDLSFISFTENH